MLDHLVTLVVVLSVVLFIHSVQAEFTHADGYKVVFSFAFQSSFHNLTKELSFRRNTLPCSTITIQLLIVSKNSFQISKERNRQFLYKMSN